MTLDTRDTDTYERERYVIEKKVCEYFGSTELTYVPAPDEEPYTTAYNKVAMLMDFKKRVIQGLEENGIMLCGGAITSAFSGANIKDLDFYVQDPEKLESAFKFIEEFFPASSCYKSINARTWTRNKGRRKYRVQIITRFTGNAQKIFDDFDFTVTQGAYNFVNQRFEFGDRFLQDIAKRDIVYCGKSQYPICALYRTLKYQRKGYTLRGVTMMHIALSIVQLKIDTYGKLKEQLFGIDTMFLQGILAGKDDALPFDYAEFVEMAFENVGVIEDTEEEDFDG